MASVLLLTEILENIAKHLIKSHLKKLRLAGKKLSEVAIPFLFNSVFLSRDPTDLKKAENVLVHFNSCIKTVVVSPLRYGNIDRIGYKRLVIKYRGRHNLPETSCFDEHVKMGDKQYGLRDELSECSMAQAVRKVVADGSKIRKLVITHRRRHEDLTEIEFCKYCRWADCPIPHEDHTMFRLSPLESIVNSSASDIGLPVEALLSEPNAKIQVLILEPSSTLGTSFSLPVIFFSRKPESMMDSMSAFLGNLTKLRLTIDQWFDGRTRELSSGAIAKQLALACNLEYLYLELLRPAVERSTFTNTLGGCHFPKLRVLIVRGTGMADDGLVTLFHHSPELKHFVLEFCYLDGYLWKDVLREIKDSTNLESLHMNGLRGGFEEAAGFGPFATYYDTDGYVDEFMFRDGPNPFSLEQLRLYDPEWWHKEQEGALLMSRKALEYYNMYF